MINMKTGVIISAAAFLLSFLLGLLNHAVIPMLIIRPIVFAVVFFIIYSAITTLVSRFLPELLEGTGKNEPLNFPGSQIDITVGSEQDSSQETSSGLNLGGLEGAPSVEGAKPDAIEPGDIEDISNLMTAKSRPQPAGGSVPSGMDHNEESGYNTGGASGESFNAGFGSFSDPTAGSPSGSAAGSARTNNSDDALPDLDSMAGAFTATSAGEEADVTDYSTPAPARKSSSNKKAEEWSEDFKPKEIAMGIRTVLEKDKKG